MRKLHTFESHANTVKEAVDEFNDRAEEFGVSAETDVVSATAYPYSGNIGIHDSKAADGTRKATLVVAIVFWADEES
jgi:hypothetical protein